MNYEYGYDEYVLVVEVKITGSVNESEVPENYVTKFSYIEKTEGEDSSMKEEGLTSN